MSNLVVPGFDGLHTADALWGAIVGLLFLNPQAGMALGIDLLSHGLA